MSKKFLCVIVCVTIALSNILCYASDIETDTDSKTESLTKTYEDFFVKDKIININIDINDADLQDMYDYAANEEYHSANITINENKVENVGIRTKGNMTLSSVVNSDSNRYSFRIKFNKYVKGQTFLGLDELCLNNGYSDSTYMREYLHYEILEKLGMNVPKRSFCNVYINGELFGFYLAVESIDDTFLEREFGSGYENGNLYKMDTGSTLEYKEDENYTYVDQKKGADTSLDEFKTFVKNLNNITDGEKGNIEDFLNVDSALKYIASNTVLCNYDSYNGNMHHNFYLYQDENKIFNVIPWDFNMSFGGFNGSNSTVGIDTPFISGSLQTLPLIGKLLSIDEYKEKYYEYIKDIMTMLENFEERVTELKQIIKPYVENDPTSFYSIEDFEKSTTLQDDSKNSQQSKDFDTEKNSDNQTQDGRRQNDNRAGDGRQTFGGTDSIINCIVDRLKSLNKQFNGTAEKTTTTYNNRREERDENFMPPEFNNDGRMPDNFNLLDNNQPDPRQDDFQKTQNQHQNNKIPDNMPPNDHNNKNTNNTVRVNVNGHIITFNTEPIIKNDTTLVEFRTILEALGANVNWNEEQKTVTAVKDDTTISLTIGSDTAYVNNDEFTLLMAPIIVENSTMVPIRFISENLGMKVSWNDETKLITIFSK